MKNYRLSIDPLLHAIHVPDGERIIKTITDTNTEFTLVRTCALLPTITCKSKPKDMPLLGIVWEEVEA